jgi:hypothetical protein
MTPAQIATAAREEYNSIGDTFFSDASIYNLITKGCNEFAQRAFLIESVDTSTTTTAGTETYNFPTYAQTIKRVEYNGVKLDPIDFKEKDVVTLYPATTTTGTPRFYSQWNRQLYLNPIPGTSSVTIKIYYYGTPAIIDDATDTIEIPLIFHWNLVDYVLMNMVAKDENTKMLNFYKARWDEAITYAVQWKAKQKRTDGPAQVKDEDVMRRTVLGAR